MRERLPGKARRGLRRGAEGSMTTESALLMPLIIFTVLMAVYLTAHIHNTAYLSAEAGEQAVTGREKEDPGLFASGPVSTSLSETSSQRTAESSSATFRYDGRELFGLHVKQKFRIWKPVRMIRAKNAVSTPGGGDG